MLAPIPRGAPQRVAAEGDVAHRARVLLADPNRMTRRALAAAVERIEGATLVATVDSREAIRDALRRLDVDVLVVDDALVGPNGDLRKTGPLVPAGVRLVVVGMIEGQAFAARAARLGAEAWIPKDRADEGLRELLARAG